MSYTMLIDAEEYPDNSVSPPLVGTQVIVNLTDRIPSQRPVVSVRVIEAHIPNLLWNITANNTSLTLTIGGVPYPVVINKGYYTGANLIAEINALFLVALAATTHVFLLTHNSLDFLDTIVVTTLGVPAAFTLATPLVTAGDSPTILELLGFVGATLVNATGTEISPNPLNSSPDRYILITCDNCKGKNSPIDSLTVSNKDWHDGILAIINLIGAPGDVIDYEPSIPNPSVKFSLPVLDTPGAVLPNLSNRTLTFRLSRSHYRVFGPDGIFWSMFIDIG